MSTRTAMLQFPGFSPLWSFGTEYRDTTPEGHTGPTGWYGIAHEFGGSPVPLGTEPPGFASGYHEVGPESDPTSALLGIMQYVQALEAERELEGIDAPPTI